jgi:nitrate/nitrite transporter NarK
VVVVLPAVQAEFAVDRAAATFGPIVADTSLWFIRHRGIAVAIAASGNYLAGTVWPPYIQHFVQTVGWRQTHIGIGVLCAIKMIPLSLALRRRPPAHRLDANAPLARQAHATLGLSPTDSADCRPCCSAPRHRCWHYCSISASAAWRRYM